MWGGLASISFANLNRIKSKNYRAELQFDTFSGIFSRETSDQIANKRRVVRQDVSSRFYFRKPSTFEMLFFSEYLGISQKCPDRLVRKFYNITTTTILRIVLLHPEYFRKSTAITISVECSILSFLKRRIVASSHGLRRSYSYCRQFIYLEWTRKNSSIATHCVMFYVFPLI